MSQAINSATSNNPVKLVTINDVLDESWFPMNDSSRTCDTLQ